MELVVVVLIIAIVGSSAIMGVSVIYNARLDNAAKRLESMIHLAREVAMANSAKTTQLKVFEENDEIYAQIIYYDSAAADKESTLVNIGGIEQEMKEKLGSSTINIGFRLGEYYNSYDLVKNRNVYLTFDPGSGGLRVAGTSRLYTGIRLTHSENPAMAEDKIDLLIIPETGRVLDDN